MKFFNERFYLKKNKILRVHVKDKSCNSLQDFRPATLLKRDCHTTTQVLGTAYFIEPLRWLLLNFVLVSKRFFKKES